MGMEMGEGGLCSAGLTCSANAGLFCSFTCDLDGEGLALNLADRVAKRFW